MKAVKSKIPPFVFMLFLCNCASMEQQGAMFSAHKAYENKDYARCLSEASSAEMYDSMSRIMKSQIMFYKAICLEGLGQLDASTGVLERLVMFYPDTDWGAAAARKLRPVRPPSSAISY